MCLFLRTAFRCGCRQYDRKNRGFKTRNGYDSSDVVICFEIEPIFGIDLADWRSLIADQTNDYSIAASEMLRFFWHSNTKCRPIQSPSLFFRLKPICSRPKRSLLHVSGRMRFVFKNTHNDLKTTSHFLNGKNLMQIRQIKRKIR